MSEISYGTNLTIRAFTVESQITEVRVSYGDVEIVINEFEQTTGDVGDVYYQGNKVGDLTIKEDGQQYIKFSSGTETSLASLMVNLNLAITLLGNS